MLFDFPCRTPAVKNVSIFARILSPESSFVPPPKSADLSLLFGSILPQGGYTGGYIWASTGGPPKFNTRIKNIAKVFRENLLYGHLFQLCRKIAEVCIFFGFEGFTSREKAPISAARLPVFGLFLRFFEEVGCAAHGYITVTSGVFIPNSVQFLQKIHIFP